MVMCKLSSPPQAENVASLAWCLYSINIELISNQLNLDTGGLLLFNPLCDVMM